MSDQDRLIEVLWDLFRSEVATGDPVHFCFSHDILQEHFAIAGLEGPIRERICSSARDCFEVAGAKVVLSLDVSQETKTDFSKVIVLVCQQVLAVEEMMSEGTQYSENAYFPRLRALMTPELPLWSANPFSFDEFESIWKAFAQEVRKLDGASDETITFEFDAYEGVNKARQFPLSQALFSRGDLYSLVSHCRVDRLRSASAYDIWAEIRRERYRLTKRAQRLINSGFLRERLIEQARRFAERLSSLRRDALPGNELSTRNASLFISLDLVDGLREEYFAFLAADDGGRRVEDTAEVTKRMNSILARRGYVYCALNKLGDCWTYYGGEADIAPGEPVILLARQASIRAGKQHLSQCCSSVEWDDSRMRSLGAGGSVCVLPVVLPSSLTDSIVIKGGLLADHRTSSSLRQPVVWRGGLCVDSRSNKYLFPYLPDSIRFGDMEFATADMVRASGTRMDWKLFVGAVAQLRTDCQYDIQFPNGLEAKLAVVFSRELNSERMGFMFDAWGRLSPTLERLGVADAAIVGFSCPPHRIEAPANIRTVARLLKDLRLRTGRALSETEVQIARNRINISLTPAPVKRVIDALLGRDPLVTDEVMKELCG